MASGACPLSVLHLDNFGGYFEYNLCALSAGSYSTTLWRRTTPWGVDIAHNIFLSVVSSLNALVSFDGSSTVTLQARIDFGIEIKSHKQRVDLDTAFFANVVEYKATVNDTGNCEVEIAQVLDSFVGGTVNAEFESTTFANTSFGVTAWAVEPTTSLIRPDCSPNSALSTSTITTTATLRRPAHTHTAAHHTNTSTRNHSLPRRRLPRLMFKVQASVSQWHSRRI
ncbi:hypothetical protein BDZ45DRAFT_808289 [Acephala macrosclerotiorum]|nr:hypothetical protein BDZ45DRAFT_808289 [Acephala macrosclerotiorum]